jgi:hypothetical protein
LTAGSPLAVFAGKPRAPTPFESFYVLLVAVSDKFSIFLETVKGVNGGVTAWKIPMFLPV